MHEGLLNPLQASQEDQNTVTMAPQKSLCPPQMKHYVSGTKAIILSVYEIFKQCFDSLPLPPHEATCAASSLPSTTSAGEGASLNICTAGRTHGARGREPNQSFPYSCDGNYVICTTDGLYQDICGFKINR